MRCYGLNAGTGDTFYPLSGPRALYILVSRHIAIAGCGTCYGIALKAWRDSTSARLSIIESKRQNLRRTKAYIMVSRHLLAAIATIVASASAAGCTREGLLAAAQSYIAAQTSGKTDGLALSASNFTYQQNNKVMDISKGLLSTAYKMDINRTSADTVECASYTMWISTSGAKPYVVGTQVGLWFIHGHASLVF
jgi:hypothetical protein